MSAFTSENAAALFTQRTDALAAKLDVTIRAVAPVIGVSAAILFSNRGGHRGVSGKTWAKLATAEKAAGLPPVAFREEYLTDVIAEVLMAHSPTLSRAFRACFVALPPQHVASQTQPNPPNQ